MISIGSGTIRQYGKDLALKTVLMETTVRDTLHVNISSRRMWIKSSNEATNGQLIKELTVQIGYDQFDQLMAIHIQGEGKVMTPVLDVRGKTCKICGHAWNDKDALQFVNSCRIDDNLFVHQTCWRGHQIVSDRFFFHDVLSEAGFRHEGATECPNERDPDGTPWHITELLDWKIKVKLGFRARVWHLEFFSDQDIKWKLPPDKVFMAEDVTKASEEKMAYIHCYSKDKVREYVKSFRDCIKGTRQPETGQQTEDGDEITEVLCEWGPGFMVKLDWDPGITNHSVLIVDEGGVWKIKERA